MYFTREIQYECSIKGVFELGAIQQRVIEQMVKMCTKKDGVYLEVEDVFIKELKASITGNIICYVKCRVKTFIPQVNEILTVIVRNCIKDKGIFCEFERCNILVPIRKLDKFSFEDGEFISKNQIISPDNFISIRVETTRYQIGAYRIIADLI
jgi:DNA-directed RNA polymerase subunit E'/Rpb7